MNSIAEVFADEHVQARHATTRIASQFGGSYEVLSPAARFSDTPSTVRLPPPLLGQHTLAVLRELGYDQERIDDLFHKRAVQ